MLLLGYIATLWSFYLLIKANRATGGERGHKTYKDFCSACGGKSLFLGYDIAVIFTISGSLLGYQVISMHFCFFRVQWSGTSSKLVSNMCQGVLGDLGVSHPEDYKLYHVIAVSAIVVFPICMLRSVNSLRYGTLISIGAVLYTCLVLFVELYFYWDLEKAKREIVWFKFDANFFSAFGITFFAFYCQVGFFPALENLLKLDEPHIKKLVRRSITMDLAFYAVIILAGYLATFDKTPDIIVRRGPPHGYEKDYFLVFGQIAIAAALCITIPLNFVPLRTALFNHLFETQELTTTRYF